MISKNVLTATIGVFAVVSATSLALTLLTMLTLSLSVDVDYDDVTLDELLDLADVS